MSLTWGFKSSFLHHIKSRVFTLLFLFCLLKYYFFYDILSKQCVFAGVSELADETDSKSVIRKGVWVRVPLPAPFLVKKKVSPKTYFFYFIVILLTAQSTVSCAFESIFFGLEKFPKPVNLFPKKLNLDIVKL